MLRNNFWILLTGSLLISAIYGCKKVDKLEATINRELESGVINDSLFLGVSFGLKQQEFYDHCWGLNKQGIVKEGPENMSVQYLFKDSLDNALAFNFYPEFDGETIHKYNTSFYYYGWAPWNKHLQSDKLIAMLPAILMDWYGGNEPFNYVKNGKLHYYKIDGNRMIELFVVNERLVAAKYIDLSHYKMDGK